MNQIVTQQQGQSFYICQVKNSDLAIFSYYVESQKEAIVIDPVFDTKVYQDIIKKRGTTLKNILMTHYHADFISGHLQFDVPIIMGQQSPKNVNNYKINELKDGQALKIGSIKLISIHTPGHTVQSTTYLLQNSSQKNICIFTGDTLFLGEVGRPDLDTGGKFTKVDMAGMLFQSLQKLKKLENQIRIYPAHGSGSACSGKKIEQGKFCTIGRQKQKNLFLQIQRKNQFISIVLQGNNPPPKYYSYDAQLNQKGPSLYIQQFNKANNPLNAQQFYKLQKNCKVFDTRVDVNQGGLIKGSYWTTAKGTITSWIPMVANPSDELLIIVDEGKSAQILNRFLRLGFFNIKGYNNFKISQYPSQKELMQIVNGKEALEIKGRTHLDIRNPDEWKKIGIIEGAIVIPLKQLQNRTKQLQGIENLVINCKSGMRARFAQSILAKKGIKSIVMADKVEQLDKIGHKMVPYFQEKQQKK